MGGTIIPIKVPMESEDPFVESAKKIAENKARVLDSVPNQTVKAAIREGSTMFTKVPTASLIPKPSKPLEGGISVSSKEH